MRNVKCVRCGNYGHQSGDRECPLKDVIMPNEESRLKRDDPLNTILAHTDPSEVSHGNFLFLKKRFHKEVGHNYSYYVLMEGHSVTDVLY